MPGLMTRILDFTPFFFFFLLLCSRGWIYLLLLVFLNWVNCTVIDVLSSWLRCLSQWDSFSWDDSDFQWIFWILQQPLCFIIYASFYLISVSTHFLLLVDLTLSKCTWSIFQPTKWFSVDRMKWELVGVIIGERIV